MSSMFEGAAEDVATNGVYRWAVMSDSYKKKLGATSGSVLLKEGSKFAEFIAFVHNGIDKPYFYVVVETGATDENEARLLAEDKLGISTAD